MRPMTWRWVLRVLVGVGVGASASGLPASAPARGSVAAPVRVVASSETGPRLRGADAASSRGRARQTLADLDPGTRAGVETAMRQARMAPDTGAVVFANRDQQLEAAFGPDGVRVNDLEGSVIELSHPRLGRAGNMTPLVGTAAAGVGTPRVTIARTASDVAVTEQWDNTPTGIEQTFIIANRPSGIGALEIQQTWRSALTPRVAADGMSVALVDDKQVRLQLDHLRAWDAAGRVLSARMEVAANFQTLAFVVDDAGARYPVTIDPTWSQQAYLKASNTDANDQFGSTVAVSGDTLVVGATRESSNATGVNGNQADNSLGGTGAAYVFVRSGATWTQQAYLKASNPGAADLFGTSVAVSGDTLVVGAPGEDSAATGVNGNQADNSTQNAGAAYVFVRSGTTWTQQAYLKASNTEAFDEFGTVAVSGDTVVVGAYHENSAATGVNGNQADNSAPEAGAAYVFVRAGTTWTPQAYLKASNTTANDEFGTSVAVSGDTLVVGAPSPGTAFVFVRAGTTWTQQASLKASNTSPGDFFGQGVAISGNTLVVGAFQEDSGATGVNGNQADKGAFQSGAAYVFVRAGTTWTQQAYLKASNTGANDFFGLSVAVSGDTLVVGAHFEDSAAGANGNQADNSATNAGAAYVFVRAGTTWTQQAYLKASTPGVSDVFGYDVAVSGDTVVVGALQEDSAAMGVNGNQADNDASSAGAAYAYSLGETPSCTYSISPTSASVPASGGAWTTDVAAPLGCSWTATSNATFVAVVSGASGAGGGTVVFQVAANNSASPRTGTLTVAGRTFTINQATTAADVTVPFGTVDTPLNNSTGVNGSIAVTGWALDDVGVSSVRIMRDPVGTEPAGQKVFIGNAVLVNGARPDVAAQYSTYPNNTRAGWGYLLLTNMLPNRGDGVFTLYSYAADAVGHSTLLGSRTITCSNSTATTPFGAIDTPGQGETVSGSVDNFGWVLSPGQRRADVPGGGTVTVIIDGAPVGTPGGWTSRSDLSALFPADQYSGIGSALAVLTFNSATLTNGVHTIAWGVTANLGGSAGIGSRYFTVANAGALHAASVSAFRPATEGGTVIAGRRGMDLSAPFTPLARDSEGVLSLSAEELDRMEIGAGASGGHLRSAIGDLPLPIGSKIDPVDGTFTWQPGPGFIGRYDLVFDTVQGAQTVRVTLYPQGLLTRPQVVIDTPAAGGENTGGFTVAGWAVDPQAPSGTGIDAIHVWAYPASGELPIFLGATTLTGARPDVGAIYGDRAIRSGYGLSVDSLPPGTYDLAVFAWSTVTQDFMPATTRRVTIR